MSGYTSCACRDCMDPAISADTGIPALCLLCEAADCLPVTGYPYSVARGSAYECQRADAYSA